MQDQLAFTLISFFSLATMVYLIVRTVEDWRGRRFIWAAVGTVLVALGAVSVTVPITTHAVKIDLPRN